MKDNFLYVLVSFCILSSLAAQDSSIKPDLETYHSKVAPLLKKFCYDCHNEKKDKGGIRLDNIDPDIISGKHSGKWEDILQQFNTGEMPPEDEKQPTQEQRLLIAGWLDREFKKAQKIGRSTAPGSIRRLTRYEFEYSLKDIFQGVRIDDSLRILPEESENPHTGFKNDQHYLKISGPHLEVYFEAVFSVIGKIKKLIDTQNPIRMSLNMSEISLPKEQKASEADAKNKKKSKKASKELISNIGLNRYIYRSGKGIVINNGGQLSLGVNIKNEGKFRICFDAASGKSPADISINIAFKNKDGRTNGGYGSSDTYTLIESQKITNPKSSLKKYVFECDFEDIPSLYRESIKSKNFFISIHSNGEPVYLESLYFESLPKDLKREIINLPVQSKGTGTNAVIAYFLEKAFRRVPTKGELEKYTEVYKKHAKNQNENTALLNTFEEILCSHKFLYLGVPGTGLNENQKKCFQLAEKLSYFLWCSIPDRALLELAQNGTLNEPVVLKKTIRRMLADEKARRFVENFTDQWLHTQNLFNIAVDEVYYKKFKDELKVLMRQETIEAIDSVFRKGDSALDLLSANHVFVNEELARHYKIKGQKVTGEEFRKVTVPADGKRGGLLTQGTFLVANSDGTDSHAILRGVALTKILLNDPPPEPPKNVEPLAALESTIPDFNKLTLNQKLIHHRDNAACKSCHMKIDPWGIPFENYDATGSWREKVLVIAKAELDKEENDPEKKKSKQSKEDKEAAKKAKAQAKKDRLKAATTFLKIERESTLVSGEKLDGISDLKKYLMKNKKNQFSQGLVEKILSYAVWREVDYHDRDLIQTLNKNFIKNNYSVSSLIEEIVLSPTFQNNSANEVKK